MNEDTVSPVHNKRAFKRPFVFLDGKISAVPTRKENDTLQKDGKIKEITFTKLHSAKEMGKLILATFPSLLGVELSRLTFMKSYNKGHCMDVVSNGLMGGADLMEVFSGRTKNKVFFFVRSQKESSTTTGHGGPSTSQKIQVPDKVDLTSPIPKGGTSFSKSNNMNFNEIIDLERGPRSELIEWLQRQHLLPDPLHCAQCNQAMELKQRNDDHVDGFLWRCTGCSKKRSLRSNTFFAEFPKIALSKLLLAIYYFLQDDPQHRAARALDFKPPLVSKIFRRLQDVCSVDLENRPFIPFGGPGTVAKCDESKFNHRPKYNRGRRAARDAWVFGIVSLEYTPARGYFQVVERRDAATLLPIIQRCLLPGTDVHSDDWAAYNRLTGLPNVNAHQVVVHAHNFVDPRTGVHTQEVESAWSQLKLGRNRRKGLRREDLPAYLDEKMWRQWRGGSHDVIMHNFLAILPLQFPAHIPVY